MFKSMLSDNKLIIFSLYNALMKILFYSNKSSLKMAASSAATSPCPHIQLKPGHHSWWPSVD
jgi:hypothetical protein